MGNLIICLPGSTSPCNDPHGVLMLLLWVSHKIDWLREKNKMTAERKELLLHSSNRPCRPLTSLRLVVCMFFLCGGKINGTRHVALGGDQKRIRDMVSVDVQWGRKSWTPNEGAWPDLARGEQGAAKLCSLIWVQLVHEKAQLQWDGQCHEMK